VRAGHHAKYLAAQLQAFKAQTRGDPDALGYMWGMAAPLDEQLMALLADYYSRQIPVAGPKGAAALTTRGKDIYQNGDPNAGIPPCVPCHGLAAAGTDEFPRLAGQHVQYLIKQLHSFQNNMRNVAVMHGVAQGLQLTDMEAVATYLQSLGP
jgi:cytochrome c553